MHPFQAVSTTARHVLVIGMLAVTALAAGPKDYTYLALGDSVAFGFNPNLLPSAPGQPLPTPSQFVGYPEIIASFDSRFTNEINAACPGETSSSFISGPPDNGCNGIGPTGQGPFKPVIGLHVNYPGTQLQFALSALAANKHIKLVTVGIGANDVLVTVALCTIAGGDVPGCLASQMPITLATVGQNLATILAQIRSQYSGNITLVKFYSPNPSLDDVARGLNTVMEQAGKPFGVRFAEVFAAFQLASALYGGDACKAGLLIKLPNGTCDVHPSRAGQTLIAASVELAVGY